jgi:hypothetical protein
MNIDHRLWTVLVVGIVGCADGTLPPRSSDDPANPNAVEPGAVAHAAASSPVASASVVYACPMHPDVTSTNPGTCPKCGMNLVPKTTP